MFPTIDYSNMTRKELESEEKKMNSQKTTTVSLIGVAAGVAVWSATHHGGVLTFGLLKTGSCSGIPGLAHPQVPQGRNKPPGQGPQAMIECPSEHKFTKTVVTVAEVISCPSWEAIRKQNHAKNAI